MFASPISIRLHIIVKVVVVVVVWKANVQTEGLA